MSITDELREFARGLFNTRKTVLDIADRIDAAHEEALVNSYFDGVFSDEELAENGFIRLPKDADGEVIHIGDTVEWVDDPHHSIEVVGVGKNTLFYIDDDANAQWTMAKTKRHHAKTVEDVLRDMLGAWGELPSNATNEAIIAEYASKLRLAESEES